MAKTKYLSQYIVGTTSACALKLFRNTIALENDEEQVSFINMRIKALWECLDQDEEVGAKHVQRIRYDCVCVCERERHKMYIDTENRIRKLMY